MYIKKRLKTIFFVKTLPIGFLVGGVLALGLNSCSTKNDEASTAGKTVLQVNLRGIVENNGIAVKRGTLASTNNNDDMILAPRKLYEGKGFDLVGDIVAYPGYSAAQERDFKKQAKTRGAAAAGLRAASMTRDVKYRLLIYNASDATYANPVVNAVISSGTDPSIAIDADKSYKWIAYSINSTSTVPAFNNGTLAGADIKGKDLLLDRGTITTKYGLNLLGISFKRRTAQIQLNVDVRGLSGSFPSNVPMAAIERTDGTSLLKYGDFNIFTDSYANLGTYSFADVPAPAFTNESRTCTYTLFTADNTTNIPVKGLQLKMGNLALLKTSTYSSKNIILPGRTLTYDNTTAFTMEYGAQYNVNCELAETGVRVSGIVWARTNLCMGTLGPQMVADLESSVSASETSAPSTDFFFGSGSNPQYNPLTTDVCKSLYPLNTWRLPTRAELQTLTPFGKGTMRSTWTSNGKSGAFLVSFYTDLGEPNRPEYGLAASLFLPLAGQPGVPALSGYWLQSNGSYPTIMGKYWYKNTDGTTGAIRMLTSYSNGVIGFLSSDLIATEPGANYSVRCVRN